MCLDPFALCNGRCANLLVDQEHCGRCGTACGAGQICFNASCANLADAGAGGAVDAATDVPKADVIADDAPTLPDAPPPDAAVEDAAVEDAAVEDAAVEDAPRGLDASDVTVPDDGPGASDAQGADVETGD